MRILLIDQLAAFLDFALRCEAQGHEVRVFMPPEDGKQHPVGRGLIHKLDDFHASMKWADLILTSDNIKYMRELESYRRRGFPLWAPNLAVSLWEGDRMAGQRILETHGITTLPTVVFRDFDSAIAHQMANKSVRYVSKPIGDGQKDMSYVSKGWKDMVFMLEHWKRNVKKREPFIFQEFTPGVEFAVGGWVGRNGFLSHFCENFEFKKLMPGEIGVNTGEMGTVVRYVTCEESKLAQEVLLPLEAELLREGFTGYIDVAVIIDAKGCPCPLEFTSRLGWPIFQIQQVLHPDVARWMKDALDGKDTFTPYKDVALGVRMSIPDFPYGKRPRDEMSGFPVWGINEQNRYNIHPDDMKLGEAHADGGRKQIMVSAGQTVLVASGCGPTVSKAKDSCYDVISQLEFPNSPIYRNDIGAKLERQLPLLQKHGYATAWKW